MFMSVTTNTGLSQEDRYSYSTICG